MSSARRWRLGASGPPVPVCLPRSPNHPWARIKPCAQGQREAVSEPSATLDGARTAVPNALPQRGSVLGTPLSSGTHRSRDSHRFTCGKDVALTQAADLQSSPVCPPLNTDEATGLGANGALCTVPPEGVAHPAAGLPDGAKHTFGVKTSLLGLVWCGLWPKPTPNPNPNVTLTLSLT